MNSTIAWCGLASLAVIGLIAVLASLAKESRAVHDGPIVVEAKVPLDRYTDPDGGSGFAPLPAVGSPPRKSALVVDDPLPGARPHPADSARVPPMVMLKPAVAARPAAARSAAAAPAKTSSAPAARSAAARPAPTRLAARTTPPKPALVKVAGGPPARLAAPARPKKAAPAPAARPESPAVDSDVALLSAIIMHANRHAAERALIESQNCPVGKKCAVSKTTD